MVINVEKNKKKYENVKNSVRKKYNIKSLFKEYIKFYKKNLKLKHIIVSIVMLIIYFVMLNYALNKVQNLNIEVKNLNVNNSFFNILLKEKIPLSTITIFAGITPFAFLSTLAMLYSYMLATNLCRIYLISKATSTLVIGSISSILQIVGLGISISTGIYYCIQSSKKFRYNQYISFGLKDIKAEYYNIRKNKDKLKKLKDKEYEKSKQREKLNVKIPYIQFLISFLISMIFLILGTLIDCIL